MAGSRDKMSFEKKIRSIDFGFLNPKYDNYATTENLIKNANKQSSIMGYDEVRERGFKETPESQSKAIYSFNMDVLTREGFSINGVKASDLISKEKAKEIIKHLDNSKVGELVNFNDEDFKTAIHSLSEVIRTDNVELVKQIVMAHSQGPGMPSSLISAALRHDEIGMNVSEHKRIENIIIQGDDVYISYEVNFKFIDINNNESLGITPSSRAIYKLHPINLDAASGEVPFYELVSFESESKLLFDVMHGIKPDAKDVVGLLPDKNSDKGEKLSHDDKGKGKAAKTKEELDAAKEAEAIRRKNIRSKSKRIEDESSSAPGIVRKKLAASSNKFNPAARGIPATEKIRNGDELRNINSFEYLAILALAIPEKYKHAPVFRDVVRLCGKDKKFDSKQRYGDLYTRFISHLENNLDKGYLNSAKAPELINAIYHNDNEALERTVAFINDVLEKEIQTKGAVQDAVRDKLIGIADNVRLRKAVWEKLKVAFNIGQDSKITMQGAGYGFNLLKQYIGAEFKPQLETNQPSIRHYEHQKKADPVDPVEYRFGTQGQRHRGEGSFIPEARVSPMFKSWVDVLPEPDAQHQYSHVYFNNLGLDRSDFAGSLEKELSIKLHDFADTQKKLAVVTLPADKGIMSFAALHSADGNISSEYARQILKNIVATGKKRGDGDFYMSDDVRKKVFGNDINVVVDPVISETMESLGFDKEEKLSPQQLQAVIFHFVKFGLTNLILKKLKPYSFNISCKDAIDRAAVGSLYFNFVNSIKRNSPMTKAEFERGLHAAATLVKGRGVNEHSKYLWNALYAFYTANKKELKDIIPDDWLGNWLVDNAPDYTHYAIPRLLNEYLEKAKPKAVKRSAAEKFIKFLDEEEVDFTPEEIKALQNGRLASIVKSINLNLPMKLIPSLKAKPKLDVADAVEFDSEKLKRDCQIKIEYFNVHLENEKDAFEDGSYRKIDSLYPGVRCYERHDENSGRTYQYSIDDRYHQTTLLIKGNNNDKTSGFFGTNNEVVIKSLDQDSYDFVKVDDFIDRAKLVLDSVDEYFKESNLSDRRKKILLFAIEKEFNAVREKLISETNFNGIDDNVRSSSDLYDQQYKKAKDILVTFTNVVARALLNAESRGERKKLTPKEMLEKLRLAEIACIANRGRPNVIKIGKLLQNSEKRHVSAQFVIGDKTIPSSDRTGKHAVLLSNHVRDVTATIEHDDKVSVEVMLDAHSSYPPIKNSNEIERRYLAFKATQERISSLAEDMLRKADGSFKDDSKLTISLSSLMLVSPLFSKQVDGAVRGIESEHHQLADSRYALQMLSQLAQPIKLEIAGKQREIFVDINLLNHPVNIIGKSQVLSQADLQQNINNQGFYEYADNIYQHLLSIKPTDTNKEILSQLKDYYDYAHLPVKHTDELSAKIEALNQLKNDNKLPELFANLKKVMKQYSIESDVKTRASYKNKYEALMGSIRKENGKFNKLYNQIASIQYKLNQNDFVNVPELKAQLQDAIKNTDSVAEKQALSAQLGFLHAKEAYYRNIYIPRFIESPVKHFMQKMQKVIGEHDNYSFHVHYALSNQAMGRSTEAFCKSAKDRTGYLRVSMMAYSAFYDDYGHYPDLMNKSDRQRYEKNYIGAAIELSASIENTRYNSESRGLQVNSYETTEHYNVNAGWAAARLAKSIFKFKPSANALTHTTAQEIKEFVAGNDDSNVALDPSSIPYYGDEAGPADDKDAAYKIILGKFDIAVEAESKPSLLSVKSDKSADPLDGKARYILHTVRDPRNNNAAIHTAAIQSYDSSKKILRSDLYSNDKNKFEVLKNAKRSSTFGYFFPPTSVPGQAVTEWAAAAIQNFVVLDEKMLKEKKQSHPVKIHRGSLPKVCVEAMVLFCETKGLSYISDTRIKVSDQQVDFYKKKLSEWSNSNEVIASVEKFYAKPDRPAPRPGRGQSVAGN